MNSQIVVLLNKIKFRPRQKVAPESNTENGLENPVVVQPKIEIPSKAMSKKMHQIKCREQKTIPIQSNREENKYRTKRNFVDNIR